MIFTWQSLVYLLCSICWISAAVCPSLDHSWPSAPRSSSRSTNWTRDCRKPTCPPRHWRPPRPQFPPPESRSKWNPSWERSWKRTRTRTVCLTTNPPWSRTQMGRGNDRGQREDEHWVSRRGAKGQTPRQVELFRKQGTGRGRKERRCISAGVVITAHSCCNSLVLYRPLPSSAQLPLFTAAWRDPAKVKVRHTLCTMGRPKVLEALNF